MATFLEELAAQRQKFLDGLDANRDDINLDIFEDFYPDQAHFIFELLQNAEDAGATEVWIDVDAGRCRFEHNGSRVFTEADVRSITGIHNSTKTKATDQIGKFGVGFKSVFVYTSTPAIWSGPFAFQISQMVLPQPLAADDRLGARTRFDLPFNNPKRPPAQAFKEVESGLRELTSTTLLFLSNIASVKWSSSSGTGAELSRVQHVGSHVEVRLANRNGATEATHFLRFDEPVNGLGKQHVSLAFALEHLTDVTAFDATLPLAKQFKIVPAVTGLVSVYFPAKAEFSGLRFHLHGPMVPELSRASIKKTDANEPLFRQLAALAAASLSSIRDQDLLTGEFLAVLPNPQDDLPDRYEGIRDAIITAMNNEPLTPVHGQKTHWPAKHLLQGRATLKALLSEEDLEYLVGYDDCAPMWAIAANLRSSAQDRLLEGLAITNWDVDEFVQLMTARIGWGYSYALRTNDQERVAEAEEFLSWLRRKSYDWHQQCYALLHRELSEEEGLKPLESVALVRCSDGQYRVPKECYFPSDSIEHDAALPRVARSVYSSGKIKAQQDAARQFLLAVGVREVGEAEEVEGTLRTRYSYESEIPDEKTHWDDLKRFIELVERDPGCIALFRSSYIFRRVDDRWGTPSQVYLDSPYLSTDLTAYFEPSDNEQAPKRLSERYLVSGLPLDKLVRFAIQVGVRSRLVVEERKTFQHPQSRELRRDHAGARLTDSSIDIDWWIHELDARLINPTEVLARLVWRTLDASPSSVLKAQFRPNRTYTTRQLDSSIVLLLRRASWVPQGADVFVAPGKASRNRLPPGFPFDAGKEWLKAIRFGEDESADEERQRATIAVAETLGFRDARTLDRAREFASLPENEQEQILAEHCQSVPIEESDGVARDAERRQRKVREAAREAPDRGSELRLRSVAERRDGVKEGADNYLRQYYTKGRVMYCQAGNHVLPFKLTGVDAYYFETVEILTRHETSKHHKQNYLCLCPNHAAMFRFANPHRVNMRSVITASSGERVQLTLAGRMVELNFAGRHIADLKAILEEDRGPVEDNRAE